MDPNKKEELIKKLEAANARKAELEAELADVKGRAAVVSKGVQEIELRRLKTVMENTLFEYSEHIKTFERDKTALIGNREFDQVFKDRSCFELVKEYCAVGALAVGAVAVGMSADPRADVDGNESDNDSFHTAPSAAPSAAPSEEDEDPSEEDEDADAVGAAAADEDADMSLIRRIDDCLEESKKSLLTLRSQKKSRTDEFIAKLSNLSKLSETIKANEVSLLTNVVRAKRSGLSEEKANQEILFGKLGEIKKNYRKSFKLSKCKVELNLQPEDAEKTLLLSACCLWDGVQLKLPDRLQPQAPPPQAQAAPPQLQAPPPQAQAGPQLQAQPPSVSGVFMKSKGATFPSFTKQERFVTIDENGFRWFDKDTKQSKGSIPLDRIVGAEAAGKWGVLFGVDIMHRGDEDHTFLWCQTSAQRDEVIATVRALVALKKGGNKNRKTIIKYRKRRHQNKKKTHKKNANKKSTKKNIRKSKTKKNN